MRYHNCEVITPALRRKNTLLFIFNSQSLLFLKINLMERLEFIGVVNSSLKEVGQCPLQEHEGAPQVLVSIDKKYQEALLGLKSGSRVLLLTWLHKANRETLTTKPRNDPNAATMGVFATRSPDRPNPIGIHLAEVLEINDGKLKISNLEVIDGTPIIDIKPILNNQLL
jgi:tRNA-Thr(GGU) m(6)t(6)A37 methyltransferase TsaA